MVKKLKPPVPKIYECQKTTCGKQWQQRVKIIYDKDNIKIVKFDASKDPQNCTRCKSPTWEIKRD